MGPAPQGFSSVILLKLGLMALVLRVNSGMFLQNLGFSINCLSVIRPASKSLSKCCYISVNISFLFCIAVMLNKKKKKVPSSWNVRSIGPL